MEELKANKELVQKEFLRGNSEVRKVLSDIFGRELAQPNIEDRIHSFGDIINEYQKNKSIDRNTSWLLMYNGDCKTLLYAQAQIQLTIIAEVLNEDWEADWDDPTQPKYSPRFTKTKTEGFTYYSVSETINSVGESAIYKSEKIAKLAGTLFVKIYEKLLIK